MGHGSRSRYAAQGAETSSGGWRVADDMWQVGTQSRWTMVHSGRVCCERVREIGEATLESTDGDVVGGVGIG